MKKTLILASFLALAPFAKGQLLLEALDAPLPQEYSFQSGEHWIVSVKDANYLPFEKANAPLTGGWTRDSGASKDPLIHFPGIITTAGEEVEVPITVTSAVTLPAGNSRVVVPADKTEDGVSRTLVLEWENTQLTTTTKTVKMKLRSEGGNLNIMLLDLLKGLGQNGKGVNLAIFALPGSATVGINVIPGIKDEAWDRAYYDGKYYHKSVYYPGAVVSKGKYVLSQELGAPITRVNTDKFNPWAKYTDGAGDQLGYLYAYGVGNNGHEVHDGTKLTFGTADDDMWTGTYQSDKKNNPCPDGFHPVSLAEATGLRIYHNTTQAYINASDAGYSNFAPFKNYSYKQTIKSNSPVQGIPAYGLDVYANGQGYFRVRDYVSAVLEGDKYVGLLRDTSSKNGADSGRLRCIRK